MNARTTFEDRLLGELQREIRLREAEVGGHGSADPETSEGRAKAAVRRVFAQLAPRRIAVVAAVCAAAWLAAVVVPGSPGDSRAYAVERHGDGSVRLTVKDERISVAAQYELAREVRPWGIRVAVAVLDPGYTCKPWGSEAVLDLKAVGKWSEPVRSWSVTLRRGDLLAFENTRGSTRPRALKRHEIEPFEVKSDTTPCVPVKRALPED